VVEALRSGSIGATTSSRVGQILDAAENSAAEIERQAWEDAARVQAAADEALAIARERVQALGEAAAQVQARLTELSGDVNVLQHTLGAAEQGPEAETYPVPAPQDEPAAYAEPDAGGDTVAFDPLADELAEQAPEVHVPELPATARFAREEPVAPTHDVEAARLIALNMAMSGESRDATDRYLAERYVIEDRSGLLDEVYASVGA
jgi:hypothetical protein